MALFAGLAAVGLGTGLAASTAYQGIAAPVPAENLSAQPAQPQHFGFADLAAKVKPAVISVRVKLDEGPALSSNSDDGEGLPFPPGSPMDKFFRQFGIPLLPEGNSKHRVVTGEGSGFFISADGYAMTNNHVVDHAKAVEVTTDDGKTYPAKVVGTDKKTDLALIKVNGRDDFPFVTFADKAPRIGEVYTRGTLTLARLGREAPIAMANPAGPVLRNVEGGSLAARLLYPDGRQAGPKELPRSPVIGTDAPVQYEQRDDIGAPRKRLRARE